MKRKGKLKDLKRMVKKGKISKVKEWYGLNNKLVKHKLDPISHYSKWFNSLDKSEYRFRKSLIKINLKKMTNELNFVLERFEKNTKTEMLYDVEVNLKGIEKYKK